MNDDRRPPRFYFRAVLQNSVWKTIAIETTKFVGHEMNEGSKVVICAEAVGDVQAGIMSIWRWNFNKYEMRADGTLNNDESLAHAFEKIGARLLVARERVDGSASNVVDLKHRRILREPSPSQYKISAAELDAFKVLCFGSVAKRVKRGTKVRGVMILGKIAGAA